MDVADVRSLVIAIDGPSGSGKSTVARGVAQRLGLRYLDTGAMYRAVTAAVLAAGVDPADPVAVRSVTDRIELMITTDAAPAHVTVDGRDVTAEIRGLEVTRAVSAVAAVPSVRTAMVRRQRELIGTGGIVVEGRDIGTTVAPGADLKVFLTADAATRAARRAHETDAAVSDTAAAIERRDELDSTRPTSPLTRAADALVIDSTGLGVDEVVERVVAALPTKTRTRNRARNGAGS